MSDRVEDYYAALNAGDRERLWALIAPDAVFHVPGNSPLSGDHRGHDQIAALGRRVLGETNGTFKLELLESLSNGAYSAVKHRWTATRCDVNIEMENIIVIRWDNQGRLAERWEFHEDAAAHDRFWTA
jgi:uncharacterized protein